MQKLFKKSIDSQDLTIKSKLKDAWKFYEKQIPEHYSKQSKEMLKEAFFEGAISNQLIREKKIEASKPISKYPRVMFL